MRKSFIINELRAAAPSPVLTRSVSVTYDQYGAVRSKTIVRKMMKSSIVRLLDVRENKPHASKGHGEKLVAFFGVFYL
jgi:hypothetical protein